MKQRQIIFRLLFPPRQYTAKTVHPAMRPFNNPTTSLKAGFSLNSLCLFATRTDMSGIAKLLHQVSYLTRIITFVQTHALSLLLCRLRTFYWDTFYRSLCHPAIVSICSSNCQANWYTRCFSQQTSFNTFFGPIRRVWAGFFPRQAGLLSWLHPSIAKTSQCLSIGHSLPVPVSRVSEKLQLWSTPEIVSELCCSSKYRFHSERSIDNQFAIRKKSRPSLCGLALSACRRRNGEYSDALVSMARSFPITRLKSCICFLLFVFSSLNPFKGTIAFEYIGNSGVIRIGS